MGFTIKKLHNRIYTIASDDSAYIYKLADCSVSNEYIEEEFNMIKIMSKKDKVFQVFDKLYSLTNINNRIEFRFGNQSLLCNKNTIFPNFNNRFPDKKIIMMRSVYDSNLVSIYNVYLNYSTSIVSVIHSILDIVNTVFRPNNFIHGDFKCNNILYNISTNEIKIIDLEFSIIVDDNIVLKEDTTINLYLDSTDTKVTKRFLFLFDIYILVKSILSCPTFFPLNLYECFMNIYNDYVNNQAFMDFVVIYSMIKNIPVKKTSSGTIDATYDIMMSELTIIPIGVFNNAFKKHVTLVHNIIATNIRINLHNTTNIDGSVFDVLTKTVHDDDHVVSIDSDDIVDTDTDETLNNNGKRMRVF